MSRAGSLCSLLHLLSSIAHWDFQPCRSVLLKSFCPFLFLFSSSSGFPSVCSWLCFPPTLLFPYSPLVHADFPVFFFVAYSLLFLSVLLAFSLSDSLPVIRGWNSLFPWCQEKCSIPASPRALISFCSLAAHPAVLAAAPQFL